MTDRRPYDDDLYYFLSHVAEAVCKANLEDGKNKIRMTNSNAYEELSWRWK